MKQLKYLTVVLGAAVAVSCTKLEETQRDSVNFQRATAAGLLQGAYNSLGGLQTQDVVWALEEHSSDEALGPTRGPDWDDNGVWRVIHNHQWDADHSIVRNTFNSLLTAQFSATAVLEQSPSASEAAQAKFIRALSVFLVLDLYDQVPFRADLKDLKQLPVTLKGAEAADKVIEEANAALTDLPNAGSSTWIANKDAARVLLMKAYLNRGVYANRVTPTFAAADMNQVITLADQILGNARYTLSDNFFTNFAPNNNSASKELIYTLENTIGVRGGNNRFNWFCTLHYNQKPSGWNGFTTLADFYDKFEAADTRRGGTYPGLTNVTGLRTGFLVGQQFDQNGTELKDRKGAPLAFTREIALRETGNNLEVTGIRVIKYVPDFAQGIDGNAENEYVIFRLADVMLMKAEAQLRLGQTAAALTIVNTLRAKRGASALTTLTLQGLLDERGREMYWEGWRRNDLVRFGKFLDGVGPTRPNKSGNERLIFPIPNQQLAVNPNLTQNPGY
ncbi:MAG: RagB/SusD family nutrient uptake outer membrane protein [Sphingobacteriales bacterium]|nr:MAG: RagB/SusD family nutrient uptake outer membrane protein [Sphingobacteriales bacterium]